MLAHIDDRAVTRALQPQTGSRGRPYRSEDHLVRARRLAGLGRPRVAIPEVPGGPARGSVHRMDGHRRRGKWRDHRGPGSALSWALSSRSIWPYGAPLRVASVKRARNARDRMESERLNAGGGRCASEEGRKEAERHHPGGGVDRDAAPLDRRRYPELTTNCGAFVLSRLP